MNKAKMYRIPTGHQGWRTTQTHRDRRSRRRRSRGDARRIALREAQ
jgi:hypothetical protein